MLLKVNFNHQITFKNRQKSRFGRHGASARQTAARESAAVVFGPARACTTPVGGLKC